MRHALLLLLMPLVAACASTGSATNPGPVSPSDSAIARHGKFTLGEPIVRWAHSRDFTLVVATGKTRMAVWDASTGDLRGLTSRSLGTAESSVAVAAGPHPLAVCTGDDNLGRAHIALALGEAIPESRNGGVTRHGHSVATAVQPKAQGCAAVAIAPNGHFVDGCRNRYLHFFQPPQLMTQKVAVRHGTAPEAMAFSPDGKLLAIAGNGLGMRSGVDGSLIHHPKSTSQKLIRSVQFTPDGKYVLTGWDTGFSVYDVAKKGWLVDARLKEFPGESARHLDVSADGKFIIFGRHILATSDVLTTKARHQVTPRNATPLAEDARFAGDGIHLWVKRGDSIQLIRRDTVAPSW